MITQRLFLYLFVDVYDILVLRFIPPILLKEPGLRLPASASALGAGLASCWPRPQQLLPVSATGGGRRRCTSSASGLTDSTRTVSPTKWKAPWERQLLGGFSFLVKPMESSHNPIFSICDSPQKSSAVQKVYRAGLAAEGRPVLVQPLSLTPFDSSPSRGASGETVHFAGTAKASPTRRGGIASAMTERLDYGQLHRDGEVHPLLCHSFTSLTSSYMAQ